MWTHGCLSERNSRIKTTSSCDGYRTVMTGKSNRFRTHPDSRRYAVVTRFMLYMFKSSGFSQFKCRARGRSKNRRLSSFLDNSVEIVIIFALWYIAHLTKRQFIFPTWTLYIIKCSYLVLAFAFLEEATTKANIIMCVFTCSKTCQIKYSSRSLHLIWVEDARINGKLRWCFFRLNMPSILEHQKLSDILFSYHWGMV